MSKAHFWSQMMRVCDIFGFPIVIYCIFFARNFEIIAFKFHNIIQGKYFFYKWNVRCMLHSFQKGVNFISYD